MAEGIHVAHALLPDGVAGAAVHVINETQSPFMVDAGSEVGQANMASEVYAMISEVPVDSAQH